MFKCLCGGGNINNNTSNNKNHTPSIHNLPSKSQQKKNPHSPPKQKTKSKSKPYAKKANHALHPSAGGVNGGDHDATSKSNTAMTKLQSTSNQTTPSPANANAHTHTHQHLNGVHKQNKKTIITPSETDNDETAVTSPSNNPRAHNKNKKQPRPKPKHVRKRTHPYKSRGDPHSSFSGTISPLASPTIATGSISDYFVYENFEFSIETFDFNLHYKFLIELAIKCLDMGPETLSPSIFFQHNDIVCCVAILQENNHQKVPTSHHKTLINNAIGFCICYPHANCRPYPDSVWMIGFLCADHHRIRAYNSQYLVIEALIRSAYCHINPKPVSALPKPSTALKAHWRETRDTKLYLNSHPIHKEEEDSKQADKKDAKKSKKKKKPRDKGIGIYAPYHHKKAQQVYEALGFEKIAKIANYYSTDRAFLDDFYSNHEENKEPMANKKLSSDAYLYCRGDLAHCRLLLGMEYFNYKKWPKPPTALGAEDARKSEEDDVKEKAKGKGKEKEKEKEKETSSKDRKKRHHGPKILEEYLQERIAKYHAKQNEQLLRNKQAQQNKYHNKLLSSQPNTNATVNTGNSVATVHAQNRSTNHSSQAANNNKSSDIRHSQQAAHNTGSGHAAVNKAHHSSRHVNTSHRSGNLYNHSTHHQNYQGHRSSAGAAGYDKRIRYKQSQQPHHANTHQKRSSGHAAGYYDEYNEVQAPNMNGTLSPNINALHKTSQVSDGGGGGGKSSRHSSAANSQISHHYHATHNSGHAGHYYHPHTAASYHHQQRPTYTQSSNAGSSGGQRSSVTPTPTYDVTHSQAMYHPPYLSNVSTASHATYTHSLAEDHGGVVRGNSFYSMGSNHSHHHSTHSNASDHPYHHNPQNSYHRHSSHHQSHQSHPHTHYMSHASHQSHHSGHHHDAVYGHPNHHRHTQSHHKHHDSYNNDDPYNAPMHQHSHKARNKRYTRSRHSSHKKLPQ